MSLVAFAVRVSACRAIRAALPSSFSVVESPQEPLEQLDKADAKPLIAIYSGHIESDIQGRALLSGDAAITLSIQIFLPEQTSFAPYSPIILDTRREGAETALDVIWRMMARGLLSADNQWAQLWREFVVATPQLTNSSYLVEKSGIRIVAREITIRCEAINEPLPGPAAGPWAALIALMRSQTSGDQIAALADWIEGEITWNATAYDEAERARVFLGLSTYVADAVLAGGALVDAGAQGDDPAIEIAIPEQP